VESPLYALQTPKVINSQKSRQSATVFLFLFDRDGIPLISFLQILSKVLTPTPRGPKVSSCLSFIVSLLL